jgi:hypothetical protein
MCAMADKDNHPIRKLAATSFNKNNYDGEINHQNPLYFRVGVFFVVYSNLGRKL